MNFTIEAEKPDIKLSVHIISEEGGEEEETLELNADSQILATKVKYFRKFFSGRFSLKDGKIDLRIEKSEKTALFALLHFVYTRKLLPLSNTDLIHCLRLNSYYMVKDFINFVLCTIKNIDIGSQEGISFLDAVFMNRIHACHWIAIEHALVEKRGNRTHDLLMYIGTLEAHQLKLLVDELFRYDRCVVPFALFWLYTNRDLKGFYKIIEKDILTNPNTVAFFREEKNSLEVWCSINDIEYFNNPNINEKVLSKTEFASDQYTVNSYATENIIDISKGEKKTIYVIGTNSILQFDLDYTESKIHIEIDSCKLVHHNAFDYTTIEKKRGNARDYYEIPNPKETQQLCFIYRDKWNDDIPPTTDDALIIPIYSMWH